MATKTKSSSKRELIEPHKGDKRYVRRGADGSFGKTVDTGRSLAADRKRDSKKVVPKGQGDRGETKRAASAGSKKKSGAAAAGKAKAGGKSATGKARSKE
jgi:hypothetical protein